MIQKKKLESISEVKCKMNKDFPIGVTSTKIDTEQSFETTEYVVYSQDANHHYFESSEHGKYKRKTNGEWVKI